jgi:hypothetical protein
MKMTVVMLYCILAFMMEAVSSSEITVRPDYWHNTQKITISFE